MSHSLFAIYQMPEDAAAFDKAYEGHLAIAGKMPGLKEVRVNRRVQQLTGEPQLYLVTELVFDSLEDLQAALGSDAGKESGRDLASWGGDKLITMFISERA